MEHKLERIPERSTQSQTTPEIAALKRKVASGANNHLSNGYTNGANNVVLNGGSDSEIEK